ncbi:MAG: hypothetical protein WDN75_00940 [Bacteroidota bacterium]
MAFYPLIVNALKDSDPHVQRVATELLMKYPTIASVGSGAFTTAWFAGSG